MSSGRIEFEFTQAKQQAKKLEEIAVQIKSLANSNIKSAMNDLQAGWSGDAAQHYINKGEQLSDKMIRVSDELENAASTIRRIAQRIYEAETAAIEIAKSRNY